MHVNVFHIKKFNDNKDHNKILKYQKVSRKFKLIKCQNSRIVPIGK